MLHPVTLRPTDPHTQEVIAFAHYLANVFGQPSKGLVELIRLTTEFRLWRRTVEYCSHCKSLAPIHPPGPSGITTFIDHPPTVTGQTQPRFCPGSNRSTRRTAPDTNLAQRISRRHLLHLIKATQPQGDSL